MPARGGPFADLRAGEWNQEKFGISYSSVAKVSLKQTNVKLFKLAKSIVLNLLATPSMFQCKRES